MGLHRPCVNSARPRSTPRSGPLPGASRAFAQRPANCPLRSGSTHPRRRSSPRKRHHPAQSIHDPGCSIFIDTFRVRCSRRCCSTQRSGQKEMAGPCWRAWALAWESWPCWQSCCCAPVRACRLASSSLLVAILAVVLAGKGIAGLQEAGLLHTSPISIPRIDLLGIYPSWQTLSAQFAVLFIIVVVFTINSRSSRQMAVQKS